MKMYGKTDVGRKRLVNQDIFDSKMLTKDCFVAVVCDGMGGAKGGGIASSIAKDIYMTELEKRVVPYLQNKLELGEPAVIFPRLLKEAIKECNSFTYALSNGDPQLKGMGTTLVTVLLYERKMYVANVGDSRMYFLQNHKLKQVTKDHSYVQEMIDSGKITEREALLSTNKNIITKAIGVEADVEPDIFIQTLTEKELKSKFTYALLCTDGLSNLLLPKDILQILTQPEDILSMEKKVDCLIDLANKRGGPDNITAYLIDLKQRDETE